MNIFLLEDDISLQNGISLKLIKEGYMVQCAADMSSAIQSMNAHFDLAIIDVNLPDASGLSVLLSKINAVKRRIETTQMNY